jgi:ACS family hexuronate transporter-like MFS transporter
LVQPLDSALTSVRSLRWPLCGLLLLAAAINYVDRQVLGTLAPDLQQKLHWTESQYGFIVASFQLAYAAGLLGAGWLLDCFGTRVVLACSVAVWSLAAMGHSLATGFAGFAVARFLLGAGEAPGFPGIVKAIAEWFPTKERAFGVGVATAGANLGAILAPGICLTLAARYGWQSAFLATGGLGLIWVVLWLYLHRIADRHPREATDPDDGRSAEAPIRWWRLFRHRQLWAYSAAKLMTDPIWWFYLFWLPKFLYQKHGVHGADLIPFLTAIYIAADAGSIAGGYFSSWLIQRGWATERARKTALFVCAAVMPLIIVAATTENIWLAVGLIALATAAHMGWAANLYTLATDLFPTTQVGSAIGIGSCAGSLAGIAVAEGVGAMLDRDPTLYLPMFLFAAVAYLAALAILQALVPARIYFGLIPSERERPVALPHAL